MVTFIDMDCSNFDQARFRDLIFCAFDYPERVEIVALRLVHFAFKRSADPEVKP